MLDQATYTPRLKAAYQSTLRAAMKEEFGYKNDMQIPRLDKIVLNMGVGEAVKDTKKVKQASEELGQIAGQTTPTAELMFEPELVVRGSTGPGPVRSPAGLPGQPFRSDAVASA